MSAGEIRLERSGDGRLARLKIERPPVNVLRVSDLEAFAALLRDVVGADVLVLSGLPRAFSAGVDVADHMPESAAIERMLAAMRAVLDCLVGVPAVRRRRSASRPAPIRRTRSNGRRGVVEELLSRSAHAGPAARGGSLSTADRQ